MALRRLLGCLLLATLASANCAQQKDGYVSVNCSETTDWTRENVTISFEYTPFEVHYEFVLGASCFNATADGNLLLHYNFSYFDLVWGLNIVAEQPMKLVVERYLENGHNKTVGFDVSLAHDSTDYTFNVTQRYNQLFFEVSADLQEGEPEPKTYVGYGLPLSIKNNMTFWKVGVGFFRQVGKCDLGFKIHDATLVEEAEDAWIDWPEWTYATLVMLLFVGFFLGSIVAFFLGRCCGRNANRWYIWEPESDSFEEIEKVDSRMIEPESKKK